MMPLSIESRTLTTLGVGSNLSKAADVVLLILIDRYDDVAVFLGDIYTIYQKV